MLNTKLKLILLCSLFTVHCSLFLTGCETVPVKETQVQLPGPTFTINNLQYKPLVSICQYYNIQWEWDTISNEATLKRSDTIIKLAANSDIALVNGRPEKLDGSVVFFENGLAVPQTFATKVLNRAFGQTYIPPRETPATNYYTLKTIVLDPGHGGADPGAVGKRSTKEKILSLDIAKRIANYLSQNDLNVILTRDSDRFISLPRRVQVAQRNKADLFVSIHINASRSRSLNGFEIYCLSNSIDDNFRAARMANEATPYDHDKLPYYMLTPTLKAILWDLSNTENRAEASQLSDYIVEAVQDNMNIDSMRIRRARFYVLKEARIPAILIEVGYISNFSEEAKLRDSSYREKLAESIGRGILAYKQKYQETDGFTR